MGYGRGIIGIYCIENMVDKKKYIGKTINIKSRFRTHELHLLENRHENQYLQNAWNKHERENFEFYILEECLEENLNIRESYFISYYKSKDPKFGYNMTDGGDGSTGFKPSQETLLKKSLAQMGDKNPMFGKTHTEEARKKISDAHKGIKRSPYSEETRKKISESNKGKIVSDETKKKMAESKLVQETYKIKNSSSKYYGVSKHKNSWRARVTHKGIIYNLGNFKTEIDAAQAFDRKNLEIRGLNAKLNFPKENYI